MAEIVIVREGEGAEPPAKPFWDSLWVTDPELPTFGAADWAVAGADEERNRGGLQAIDPLGTAILLCLFTDRRRPDEAQSPDGSGDRRGWHGDTFDVVREDGERELGSLLWTLERAAPTEETEADAEHYAAEALQTLVDQGLVSRFDIDATAVPTKNRLELHVKALAPDGRSLFANTFPLF